MGRRFCKPDPVHPDAAVLEAASIRERQRNGQLLGADIYIYLAQIKATDPALAAAVWLVMDRSPEWIATRAAEIQARLTTNQQEIDQ